MSEITVTKDNFEQEVLKSDHPVLVDFWAEWCGPCHAIAPALSELADEYKEQAKIAKVNVDENPELAQQYQITSIPNMKIFKDGQIVDELIGVTPKEEIKTRIKKHI